MINRIKIKHMTMSDPQQNNARSTAPNVQDSERIAKKMARAGVASRRDSEAMIRDGREREWQDARDASFLVTDRDKIMVDGKAIGPIERTRLWLLHKTCRHSDDK